MQNAALSGKKSFEKMKGTPMTNNELLSASSAILQKAKEFGVHLAGFAYVDDLKVAPSFVFAPKMPGVGGGIGSREGEIELNPG
jgi:hypothetical protein